MNSRESWELSFYGVVESHVMALPRSGSAAIEASVRVGARAKSSALVDSQAGQVNVAQTDLASIEKV